MKIDTDNMRKVSEVFGHVAKLGGSKLKSIYASLTVTDGSAYLTMVEPEHKYAYASLKLPADAQDMEATAILSFWTALGSIPDDVTISAGPQGILAESKRYSLYAANAKFPAWPLLAWAGEPVASLTMSRKNLITILKGLTPRDQQARCTIKIDNSGLTVYAFGDEDKIEIPAKVQGQGVRTINAKFLSGLLGAVNSKEVTIGWGVSPAIVVSAASYRDFTVLLAGTTLSA